MSPRHSTLRLTVAACCLLGLTARAAGELAASSPFLPQGKSALAPTANTPLEFRGITAEGRTTKFSIFDPTKKSGTWVGLDESGYEFTVRKYDADTDTVTVDFQGRTMSLAMKTPKVASLGTAIAPLPPAMPIGGPVQVGAVNPVTRNVVANPTPATEAARLADWQAEIQRRRDMRAQTATTPGQVVAPVPPPVQPQVQQTQPRTQSPNAGQPQNGQRTRAGQQPRRQGN